MTQTVPRSVILGTGSAVPSTVVTNDDLAKIVDTSDEWITTRTGIKERRVLEENQAASDLALRASERALEDAGITAEDLDAIICGTCTADYQFPSLACVLEAKLGAREVFVSGAGPTMFAIPPSREIGVAWQLLLEQRDIRAFLVRPWWPSAASSQGHRA